MPKYKGNKKKTHSVHKTPPSDRAEARRKKFGVYLPETPCPNGHKGPRRTLSDRCTTCEKMGIYEDLNNLPKTGRM